MSWSDDFVPTDDERVRLIRREDAGSIPAVLMVPDGTPSPLRELAERGVENPKAIPSLRTEKAFRADLVRQGIPNVSIDAYGNSRTLGKVYVRIVRPSSEKTYWVVGLEWRTPDGHAKYPTTRK